mgnify:CR=1 FL=1
MRSIPQFLIAAPTSGSGKTTVSRGLMALFVKKGLKVQPFKCGPDYIDTKVSRGGMRPSFHQSGYFHGISGARKQSVCTLFGGCGCCRGRGMMGMYDGYDRDRGSSAEVARLLGIPVVLMVDAKSAAYSMAPLLSGFINFRPDIRIAGVIFNRVGSLRHYRMLQEVCEDLNVTCLAICPSRRNWSRSRAIWGWISAVLRRRRAGHAGRLAGGTCGLGTTALDNRASIAYGGSEEKPVLSEPGKLHISVARNEESFSFLYAEHLDILRRMGTVTFFNPEQDRAIPQETDLLYLPAAIPRTVWRNLPGQGLPGSLSAAI